MAGVPDWSTKIPVPVCDTKLLKNVPRPIVGLPATPSPLARVRPALTAKVRPVTVFEPVLTCMPVGLEFNDKAAPVILT